MKKKPTSLFPNPMPPERERGSEVKPQQTNRTARASDNHLLTRRSNTHQMPGHKKRAGDHKRMRRAKLRRKTKADQQRYGTRSNKNQVGRHLALPRKTAQEREVSDKMQQQELSNMSFVRYSREAHREPFPHSQIKQETKNHHDSQDQYFLVFFCRRTTDLSSPFHACDEQSNH